jgi:hypothetical protein
VATSVETNCTNRLKIFITNKTIRLLDIINCPFTKKRRRFGVWIVIKKLRGLWSASEIYRLSDRHLLVKFSANFCG